MSVPPGEQVFLCSAGRSPRVALGIWDLGRQGPPGGPANKVSIIDSGQMRVATTLDFGAAGGNLGELAVSVMALSPDGNRLAVVTGADLWVMDLTAAGVGDAHRALRTRAPGVAPTVSLMPFGWTHIRPTNWTWRRHGATSRLGESRQSVVELDGEPGLRQ